MDELFFGARRRRKTTPTRRRRSTPTRRRRATPVRRRRSPIRRRASPRRRTAMCNSKMSLSKLRKLAEENGVNVYSEAKVAVSKRTGLPKKSKKVGCATLMKRLKDAGLESLYKTRTVKVDMQDSPFDNLAPDMPVSPALFDDDDTMSSDGPVMVPVPKDKSSPMPTQVMMQADPACAEAFQKLAEKQPNNRAQAKFLKQYKGYAMGQGPCDKRELVPVHMHGDEDELDNYADVAGFDMSYGRRYLSGARPRSSVKHVGNIMVNGRVHHVFRGKQGGLFYMKGKSGRKIYIDPSMLRKRKM